MVRPWKPPSAATMRVRPVRRAILNAASLASAPELHKKTRLPSGASHVRSSASASATCTGVATRLETCPSVASWAETAPVRAGWAWPSAVVAMPASRSTYRVPSASQT